MLRDKYRHLFRDASATPYLAVSYQWKAALGDVLEQVHSAMELDMDHKGLNHFWLDVLAVKQRDEDVGAEMRVVHEVYAEADVHVVSDAANLRRAWVLYEVAFGSVVKEKNPDVNNASATQMQTMNEAVGRIASGAAPYDRHSVVLSNAELRRGLKTAAGKRGGGGGGGEALMKKGASSVAGAAVRGRGCVSLCMAPVGQPCIVNQ